MDRNKTGQKTQVGKKEEVLRILLFVCERKKDFVQEIAVFDRFWGHLLGDEAKENVTRQY